MKKFQVIALVTSLAISLAVAPSVQAKAKPKAFNGKTCTIVGTSKSEKLTGTSKADVICGLGGNDTINGSGGNDTIDGGVGNDVLSGGDGNDAIDGGTGNDTVNGQNGNDVLTGDTGNDSLNGGAGNDSMQGETGADVFIGGAGTDTAKYSEKTTGLTLDIDNAADDGASGEKDNIKTDVENITGGSGNDVITGGTGANTISGGSGNDIIYGGSGNDSLVGNLGVDLLDGGAGRNFCKIDEDDPKYLTCAGNYLELSAKKIEGRITFDASTALFKLVVQNKGSSWQNLSYQETHYAPDGDPKWGGGAGIGWLGPGQTYVGIGDWDPNGDFIAADPEAGQEAYETFGVFTINASGTQYVREDPVDPQNNPQIEIQHEINSGVLITLGEGEFLDNRWVVNYTAVNNTNVTGPLTLFVQSFNQKGEMICQGSNTSVSEDNRTLQANSQFSGVASFDWMGCNSSLMNLRRYQISLVSLN